MVDSVAMSKADCPPSGPRGKRDIPAELFAALRRLGAERPFETMSVREIAREAGLSTRTFYNHFRSKYDLVIRFYAFDDFVAMRRARAGGAPVPWKELVLRQYYAGFLWVLVEWLESPSPKSVDGFLSDLVAALPAPLRPVLL